MSESSNDIFELNEQNNEDNLFKRVPVSVFKSDIWLNELPFSKKEAYIDLYSLAFDSYENASVVIPIRESFVRIFSGQVAMGLRQLGKRWQWSPKKVNNYLLTLEELGEINIITRIPVTIIYLIDFVHRINNKGNKKETKVLRTINNEDA